MTRRSRPAALAVLLVAAALMASPAGAEAEPPFVLDLEDRTTAFWSGPGEVAPDCGSDCWSYRVEVTEPAYRLRVGIDRPTLQNVWRLEVIRPSGQFAGSASPGTDLYSAEVVVPGAQAGTYEVRAIAEDVEDLRFRMRAKLEVDNGGLPQEHVLVPPDLVPLPPWEFSFLFPVTNGAMGGESTGIEIPGGRVACHPEEVALYLAVRCLRMSFGVANLGLGPLDLQVGPGAQFQDRPLVQRVYYADQGSITRDAGNAYYHHSHLHYHHDKAIGLELLRVVDPDTGSLQAAGEEHLKGFAHRDELLRDWTLFAPIWSKAGFGLLPGWGDYYEWDRPANIIDFGLNGDGLYVLRMTADPEGLIQETDTTNNVAYSLIRVTGDQVEHLESGRGTDPWDPCRTPLPLGSEWEDSFELTEPRPEDCPE